MAISTCIKCGGTKFENKSVTPKGSNFVLTFIQCASCGGVVGVMDYYNLGQDIQEIKKVLHIS
jgi:hypothetical protein